MTTSGLFCDRNDDQHDHKKYIPAFSVVKAGLIKSQIGINQKTDRRLIGEYWRSALEKQTWTLITNA